jgi:hypothetical protein
MLVMPASIVVDKFVHGTQLAPMAVVGAVCIVLAFALLNVSTCQAARSLSAAAGVSSVDEAESSRLLPPKPGSTLEHTLEVEVGGLSGLARSHIL